MVAPAAGKKAPKKAAAKTPAKPKAKPRTPVIRGAPKPRKSPVRKATPAPAPEPQPMEFTAVPDEAAATWVEEPAPATSPAATAGVLSARRTAPRPFDPVTGEWIPVEPAKDSASGAPLAFAPVEPDAPRKSVAATVWTVILGIDLALLALNVLLGIVVGLTLVFAPDSAAAEDAREALEGGSRGALVAEVLLTFLMMGVIPLLWVINTRQEAWEGTKRFLRLHAPGKSLLQGLALTPVLLLAVAILSSLYILATEGPDGFSATEGDNPAVDALIANLTLPIALLVAFCAGVGEEILFRGVLFRRIGLWGQAVLFGLAHALGGYIPQVLFAFGLAILFGKLLQRGWSLIALMTAHFLYDLVLLCIGLAYG